MPQMIFIYTITKCLSGMVFSGLIMKLKHDLYNLKRTVWRYIGLFLVSSSFVTFIVELFWMFHSGNMIELSPFYAQIIVITEYIAIVPAIYATHKLIRMSRIRTTVIYLEFLCIERLTSILAFDILTYFVFYIFFMLIVCFQQKDDLKYIARLDNSVDWTTIAVYLIGLKLVLDEYYFATALFSELRLATFNVQSAWLDLTAILTTLFFSGFFKMSVMNAKETDQKMDYMRKFQNAQEKIIQTFAEIMEAKSGETGKHVKRVAEYSYILAAKLDPDCDYLDYLRVASMMHDVGKLMIPMEILEKPGKLDDEEFRLMQTHTDYGNTLLSHSDGKIMEIARAVAYEHHEQWNGQGYPRGLRGDEISIYAQIVSVADVYDALTSERAYKKAWPPEKAKEEILKQSGMQFSPKVVDAFAKCFDEIEDVRKQYHD